MRRAQLYPERSEQMTIREQTEQRELESLSPFACRAADSKGRMHPLEPCHLRTCFQRDADRIVHSKAFRRLTHKTQVFLRPEGDHYRTRMTHTLEVARIARTMARGLLLNEDLTEACALGHDLGHTPFGHAGERALNEIMSGGFRHNEQSLRVVDVLEDGGEGLNLCHEVREGILCHTKGRQAKTLEGQIIRLADRIAYINHDIDDALRGGIIFPMDIPVELCSRLGFSHGSRIDNLVADVIESSCGQNQITQSPEHQEAMEELRKFMFKAVYRNPVAKGEEGKAEALVKTLFEHFAKKPDLLPKDFQEIRVKEGAERASCDYIAGMTDKYAVELFETLFIPHAWAVK
ncbi:MAG: deoxyguanosinetriphosphate triphosphohydrolase [Oscillospiraceae bacterium]|nr:deoxyguanosinetriphosphate triphosphohydrolase [Oscillospiraceae bacterium]